LRQLIYASEEEDRAMDEPKRRPRIFAECPEDIDETWTHGFIIGGMARLPDHAYLAWSFRTAGDLLIEHVVSHGEAWEVAYPALYLYRHAIELHLKSIVDPQNKSHGIGKLTDDFIEVVRRRLHAAVPEWFEQYVREFDTMDPSGTTFRYAAGAKRTQLSTVAKPGLSLRISEGSSGYFRRGSGRCSERWKTNGAAVVRHRGVLTWR
jgi:hypothetical protein